MSYTQLTEVERYQIQSFLKAGYTQKAIAEELGKDSGMISKGQCNSHIFSRNFCTSQGF